MKLPSSAHTSRPWRIHEMTRDFRLEDVWALPTPGGPDDFGRLVQLAAAMDPADSASVMVRNLFAVRWKLGALLRLDEPHTGLDSRVPSLRSRLPVDLRIGPSGPYFDALPFRPLYLTANEFAAEIANQTMHGVLHLSWVPDATAGYHGQIAVLVKPNGLLGEAYMRAIAPFRYWLVYPPMIRAVGRTWSAKTGAGMPVGTRV